MDECLTTSSTHMLRSGMGSVRKKTSQASRRVKCFVVAVIWCSVVPPFRGWFPLHAHSRLTISSPLIIRNKIHNSSGIKKPETHFKYVFGFFIRKDISTISYFYSYPVLAFEYYLSPQRKFFHFGILLQVELRLL